VQSEIKYQPSVVPQDLTDEHLIMPRSLSINPPGPVRKSCISVMLSVYVATASGCNLCCPPYMDDYATIGGKWQRSHPSQGTVGSALSDPGVMHASAEGAYHGEQVFYGEEFQDVEIEYPETSGEFAAPYFELPSERTSIEDGTILDESPDSIIILGE